MTASELTRDERDELLALARGTLASLLAGGPIPARRSRSDGLQQRRGVFVTLWQGAELRGCMGNISGARPLDEAVPRAAAMAALDDPRFLPVTSDELPGLRLEISVLGALEPVGDVGEIQVGVHGLLIRSGELQGLLLPQVAVEAGWDRGAFLQGVCRKAGLPGDAWASAELYRFTAEVFEEAEP